MVLENNLSLVKKVNRLLSWGHWFSFFNILLALAITAVYWLSEPSPQTILGWLYLLINWIGHTAFLCFMFFILTIFPVSLFFPYQRHVRGIAAILATAGLVLLIFDAYVYAALGYHIGSASFDQTVDLLRQQIVTNLRNFILIVAATSALLLAIELTVSNFCWKKIERLKQSVLKTPLMVLFTSCFMLSHVLHIYADANLKWDITKQDNVLPLSYPATAKTFLEKYQLVDLSARAEKQQQILTLPAKIAHGKTLHCTANGSTEKTLLILTDSLSVEQQGWFRTQGFRLLEQHFAPTNQQEALLNLLYGQFVNAHNPALLQHAPAWLQQLPNGLISISKSDDVTISDLPWLENTAVTTHYAIVFDNAPQQHWAHYQSYHNIAVISLAAEHPKFSLAPATVMTRWPGLMHDTPHTVTQHLDWLPTLLHQAGCTTEHPLLGDNLTAPSPLPKLNISQQEMVSFKKDKMVILRPDGSYGVWSAGTLVPLNEKLDIPMLTDALKRINIPAEKTAPRID